MCERKVVQRLLKSTCSSVSLGARNQSFHGVW